jgi:peptidoglycan/LPS O-acetylase OafA/YrhL
MDVPASNQTTNCPKPPPQPSQSHLLFLDALRGFAILSVFLFHCFVHSFGRVLPGNLLSYGWIGVPVFFVISGFCIHLSHVRSKENGFGKFFIRRFFRIWPPYLAALLFFAFVFPPTRLHFDSSRDFFDLISHLFLAQNVVIDFYNTINGSFWSIAIEAQLYLIYPLLLWLTLKLGWMKTLLLALLLESCANANVPYHIYPILLWMGPTPFKFWFSWAIGAAIAAAWLNDRPLPFTHALNWIWPLLFVLSCCVPKLGLFSFTFAALSAAAFTSYALSHPSIFDKQKASYLFSHLRWAGTVSYSFYLLHEPLITALVDLLKNWGVSPNTRFLCSLATWPLLLGLAYISFHLFEQPSISFGKRLMGMAKKDA